MNEQNIHDFLTEINSSTSSNYKLDVLKKYKDDSDIKKLLSYTYDKVNYTFNIRGNWILEAFLRDNIDHNIFDKKYNINNMFNLLDELNRTNRNDDSTHKCFLMYDGLSDKNKELFVNILNRDLKIGINYRQINKIFKNLIPKPQYSRCDIFNDKNTKNINFPAYIQLKMDGTYREYFVHKDACVINGKTRAGETYANPYLEIELSMLENGYYFGELTIEGSDNRMENNGLINSLNPPNEQIIFTIWDHLTIEEYKNLKIQRPYKERFEHLKGIINNCKYELSNIKLIECHEIQNTDEALKYVSGWMSDGLEGGVLKDFNYKFKNGTSKQQLKIKLKVDADLRIIGFTDGTIGTKREGKIGAIQYESDDKMVKGQCSGFTDEQMDYFTDHKNDLIGKIITVEFCDITKAQNNDYYALLHPRFKEIRNDKTETDNLDRIIQMRDMSKKL